MTTLEKVLELKRIGIPDSEIQIRLKNEGISPMEINDAMNQSKIKEAVYGEREFSKQGMVPSIMGGTQEEESSSENLGETYTPAPAPSEEEYEDYSPGSPNQNYLPPPSPKDNYPAYGRVQRNEYPGFARDYEEEMPAEEEFYENPSENYSAEGYQSNSETMIEIAEQVFSEKIKKMEEDLRKLKEFRTLSVPALEDINERLKRIERSFDKMQIAILDKVGSFGRNIDSLKKEVEMVEDSVEKINKHKK